jgi:uncharacterized membrane protein YbhN (UPF0104 family)
VLVSVAVIARRRALVIDLLLAALAGVGLSLAVQVLFGVAIGRPVDEALSRVDVGFPIPVLTAVVAMVLVGRPSFARSLRRLSAAALLAGGVGVVTTGRGLPLALVGSFSLALVAASLVRLWRGAPVAEVAPAEVSAVVRELVPSAAACQGDNVALVEWGVDRRHYDTAEGTQLVVSVYGRDSRDAELLSSLSRVLFTRDSGVSPFIGRQQQAEHEALVVSELWRATSGRSAQLVGLRANELTGDVIVVSEQAPTSALDPDQLENSQLREMAELVASSHRHALSLGTVAPEAFALASTGTVVVVDAARVQLNATDAARGSDVASLLATLAHCSTIETAVETVGDVLGADALVAAMAFLQKAALSPRLRRASWVTKELLSSLRERCSSVTGVEVPELAPLRRVSAATLVLVIGTLVGGWALLGVLVNVAASVSTLRGADWAWVVVTFVLSQATFGAVAISDLGSITGTLPWGRLAALEVANTFSGLAAGTVAVMAARVRFFQRVGYDATTALSSGVLVSMVSWIVKGALFALALPFAWSSLSFKSSPSSGSHSHAITLILLALVAGALAVALVLAVPRWRRVVAAKMAPKVSEVRELLRDLASRPVKMAQMFGGTIAAQLLVALALGASLHAFDAHLSIALLLVVLTLGSMLGGVSPVPGAWASLRRE